MTWQLGKGRFIRLFGMDIFDTTLSSAANWLVKRAAANMQTDAAFVNAHYINISHHNDNYRQTISRFDRVFADGIGMKIAAKANRIALTENVNGTDLFPLLCLQASRHQTPVYFLGSKPGIAEAAAQRAVQENPRLIVAGTHHGYLADSAENDAAIRAINTSGAKLLLVGMGVPEQELWIAANRAKINVPVIIAVGGLLDFISGTMARAPLAFRRHGLEWVWRLALEPRRMWRRYVLGNTEFLARLAWQTLFSPAAFDQSLARQNILPTTQASPPEAANVVAWRSRRDTNKAA